MSHDFDSCPIEQVFGWHGLTENAGRAHPRTRMRHRSSLPTVRDGRADCTVAILTCPSSPEFPGSYDIVDNQPPRLAASVSSPHIRTWDHLTLGSPFCCPLF